MKMPRNIDAVVLIKALATLEYTVTRQTGSHIRLTTNKNGQHHLTIPNHKPLKIGTFNSILSDVAHHFEISKEDLLKKLFR